MRWKDFDADVDNGMLKIWNIDGWAIWADNTKMAYERAPDGYGIVVELEKDDEDYSIPGQPFAIFKTTTDRDLWLGQE